MPVEQSAFEYSKVGPGYAHAYLLPTVLKLVEDIGGGRLLRIADLGCGNGYIASRLAEQGHAVTGIDLSSSGIEIARSAYPKVSFHVASIYDESLPEIIGEVDCVISLEVIEHLFYPKKLLEQAYRVLKSQGVLILSTPYHGYLKTLSYHSPMAGIGTGKSIMTEATSNSFPERRLGRRRRRPASGTFGFTGSVRFHIFGSPWFSLRRSKG